MVSRFAILLLLLCQACSAQSVPSTSEAQQVPALRVCVKDELSAHAPSREEIKAHRQFDAPVITRPFGAKRDNWELGVLIKVDEKGHPACYYVEKDEFRREQALDDERRDVLSRVASWHYAPFIVDGRPVVSLVKESIREQIAPERHLPLPNVPMSQVAITLERTGCYGTCPAYWVTLYGDGRAVYEGRGYVDVLGRHEYRVDPARIAALVESARGKDIWSMANEYRYPVTDNPTYFMRLKFGDQGKEIEDYVGGSAGMPEVISEFEDEIDRAAESNAWINLGMPAVERLSEESFPFVSKEGEELLGRAISNSDGHDDAAILKLMSLGAMKSASTVLPGRFGGTGKSLLESALGNRRQQVVEHLIELGALQTNDRVDQSKLDAAFRAAIGAGSLQGVETIWSAGGDSKPSLTFDDKSEDDKGKNQRSSVILLLSHPYGQEPWEGQAIAEWLVAKGCDLKARAADGDTLLHRATDAGDLPFVRYLLANGLDASTPGTYGLPALGSAENEDIALVLLQAGSDWKMDDGGKGFLQYANDQHWGRVLAWVRAHGGKNP